MASGIANLVALINKMPSLPLSMGGRPNADAKEEEEELEEDTKRWRFTWIKFTWNAWNYLHFWRLRYAAVIINNIVVVIIIFVVVAAGVRLNRLVFIPPSRAWPLFIFVVGSFFFWKTKILATGTSVIVTVGVADVIVVVGCSTGINIFGYGAPTNPKPILNWKNFNQPVDGNFCGFHMIAARDSGWEGD